MKEKAKHAHETQADLHSKLLLGSCPHVSVTSPDGKHTAQRCEAWLHVMPALAFVAWHI